MTATKPPAAFLPAWDDEEEVTRPDHQPLVAIRSAADVYIVRRTGNFAGLSPAAIVTLIHMEGC